MAKPTLKVTVRSRQGMIFEGDVVAVSSINMSGLFDVLPGHANFVCMISKKLTLHGLDNKIQEINLENGVLMVERDLVKVFLGISKI